MSDHVPAPMPEEPDILIQDLEDIPQEPELPDDDTNAHFCARCERRVPDDAEYCDECLLEMQAYPLAPGAWIGAVLVVLTSIFALFVLGVNLLIAHPVVQGDAAFGSGDLRACYAKYTASYDTAQRLNDLLFTNGKFSFFSNGARTLEKQIHAAALLNGPFFAGRTIDSVYNGNPPGALREIYAQYTAISAFVNAMQQSVSDYRDKLPAGSAGDYDDMIALVDAAQKKLPQTPDYMVQYYRFSVSYSLADDPARTCALLDDLIAMQPDALWLWASEGIHAYDLGGEYVKALSVCNQLMQRDASDPATVAYTMMQLRLLGKPDEALAVYDRALALTEPSSEMQRQKAIVLMLDEQYDEALDILIASYSPKTATLDHLATIALCAKAADNAAAYKEYKTLLDSYIPYEQVDLFAAGDVTLEDIFLTGGGEVH